MKQPKDNLPSLFDRHEELNERPSFFDFAYHELSHETVLQFALDAYQRRLERNPHDSCAADFGEKLLSKILGEGFKPERARSLAVYRQTALGPGGKDRIDLLVDVVEASAQHHWAVIETKLGAPGDSNQLVRYRNALKDFPDFKRCKKKSLTISFYKTGH